MKKSHLDSSFSFIGVPKKMNACFLMVVRYFLKKFNNQPKIDPEKGRYFQQREIGFWLMVVTEWWSILQLSLKTQLLTYFAFFFHFVSFLTRNKKCLNCNCNTDILKFWDISVLYCLISFYHFKKKEDTLIFLLFFLKLYKDFFSRSI